MTLFRQISLFITVLFIILLIVLAWNDFRQSSTFLQGQLQSTANDMATTLGVTIATAVKSDDVAEIDTLLNSVFDSGYYSKITLTSMDGKEISGRSQPIVINSIPKWFIEQVEFPVVEGKTQIMKGWLPYGTLSIVIHPGYAYSQLYLTLQNMLIWFGLIAVAGIALLSGLIHLILRPLKLVKEQAEAIHENRFIQQPSIPHTVELGQVVRAMNRMVSKVQTIFDDQSEIVNKYHEALYRDMSTGLGNRRYFVMRLNELCGEESVMSGWLALISIHGFEDLLSAKGFEKAEELANQLAKMMIPDEQKDSPQYASRLKPDEFIIYLSTGKDGATNYLKNIFQGFKTEIEQNGFDKMVWLYGCLTPIEPGHNVGTILSEADFALTQAKSMGAYSIYMSQYTHPDLPHGKQQWRNWLSEALAEKRFFLSSQPALNPDGSLFHREMFARLKDSEDHVIAAGAFIPVATSLGLEFEIDKQIFQKVTIFGRKHLDEAVAINLSSKIFTDTEALLEFEQLLKQYVSTPHAPLHIEVGHYLLLQHSDIAEYITELLREYGCIIGVDRLDLGCSLQILQIIRPDYVKIGVRQLEDITDDEVHTAYQSLKTVVEALDIEMITVGVDSQEMIDRLNRLGISIMQGEFLGKPQEVEE